MMPIPYGKQEIMAEDIDLVVEVLQSDFLTQGPYIGAFEERFAEFVGAKFAVAVANGTAALHLSSLALRVQPESRVITSPITFVASANCVQYGGGEVDFVDIDPSTYLMDLNKLRDKLERSPQGTYQGIVSIDFAGRAVDLEQLRKLADKHRLWIIEDASHAPGGYFMDSHSQRQLCGNGLFAELSIFSFHPVKHIAAGEGGMITTNNEQLYQQLLTMRSHGMTKEVHKFQNDSSWACGSKGSGPPSVTGYPAWYMEMQQLGFNYRLSDIHAALGLSQLRRAGEGLKKRKELAQRYYEAFQSQSYILGQSGIIEGHAYHLYVLEVEDRLGLYNFLRSKNVFTQIHYIPVHLMPYYRQLGWGEEDFPQAEKYYRHCISLPLYPSLSREEQEYVIQQIRFFYHG